MTQNSKIKKLLALIIVAIFCCGSLNSCSTQYGRKKGDNIYIDTKIKYQQLDSILQQLTDDLNLETIRKGYSSLQYRLWYELLDTTRLIIIKNNGTSKTCEEYTFGYITKKGSTYILIHDVKKNLTPKSGWDSLVNMLDKQEIKSLPDMKDAIKHPSYFLEGGKYYYVEVALPDSYRCYLYIEPQRYKDSSKEAEHLSSILGIIKEELDIYPFERRSEPAIKP